MTTVTNLQWEAGQEGKAEAGNRDRRENANTERSRSEETLEQTSDIGTKEPAGPRRSTDHLEDGDRTEEPTEVWTEDWWTLPKDAEEGQSG